MVTRLQTNKRWSQQRHGQILKTQSSSSQITKDQQSPISTIATFTNLVRNPSEYSDCSAGNGNNANLRFSVTNHSINSYDTIRSTRSISLQNSNTDKFKRRPWLKLAIVIIVVLVLAGISAAVTVLVLRNKPDEDPYQTTVELNVHVNDTYQTGMEDNSSKVFKDYQYNFCYNLNNNLSQSKGTVLDGCQITQLRNGSVIIRSLLTLITGGKPSMSLDRLFKGEYDSSVKWGSFNVINVSINSLKTEKYQNISLLPQTCSPETEWGVLPLNDTYPHKCDQFQLCRNGIATSLTCKSGLEFTLSDSSTCDIPSPSTYCGKRRYQDLNQSASTPSTSTTLARETTEPSTITSGDSTTTSTEGVTTRTSSSTTTRFSSGTTTSNSASCSDGENTYLPKNDTYPYKCNQFIQCVSGLPVERCCAPGLYFSIDTWVCDWPSSNNTYCGIQNGWKENITSTACNSTTNDNTTLAFPINVTALLFTCDVSVVRQFIPTDETYPNSCDKFTDCVSGIPHNQTCAAGTHFTPYPWVCDHIDSSLTYCALRRAAETSYSVNVLTTNPAS